MTSYSWDYQEAVELVLLDGNRIRPTPSRQYSNASGTRGASPSTFQTGVIVVVVVVIVVVVVVALALALALVPVVVAKQYTWEPLEDDIKSGSGPAEKTIIKSIRLNM